MGVSSTGSIFLGNLKLFLLDGSRLGFRDHMYVLDRFFLHLFRLQGFRTPGNSLLISFLLNVFLLSLQNKLRASLIQNLKLANVHRTDNSSGQICIIGSAKSWDSLWMHEYNYYLQLYLHFSNIQGKDYSQDDSWDSHCGGISWIDIFC